jgi:hypothetical protein
VGAYGISYDDRRLCPGSRGTEHVLILALLTYCRSYHRYFYPLISAFSMFLSTLTQSSIIPFRTFITASVLRNVIAKVPFDPPTQTVISKRVGGARGRTHPSISSSSRSRRSAPDQPLTVKKHTPLNLHRTFYYTTTSS